MEEAKASGHIIMVTGWTLETKIDGVAMGPTDIGEAWDIDYDTGSNHELIMRIVERLFMGDVSIADHESAENPPDGFTRTFRVVATRPDGQRYGFQVERVIEGEEDDGTEHGGRYLSVYATGVLAMPDGQGDNMAKAFRGALRKHLRALHGSKKRHYRLVHRGQR